MVRVNTHEAKTRLSELLAAVEDRDEQVLICRNGKPVAELRRVRATTDPFKTDPKLAAVKFYEDPVAPLTTDDWPDPDAWPGVQAQPRKRRR